MFWIKDCNGALVNLAIARRIVATHAEHGDKSIIGAFFMDDDGYQIFRGTREQCGRFMDELLRALKERENAKNVVDVILERT